MKNTSIKYKVVYYIDTHRGQRVHVADAKRT